MKVLVDTSVWSLALRHGKSGWSDIKLELTNLIDDRKVKMIGPIRQELLSGVRREKQFNELKKRLSAFPDVSILTEDYENAAHYFNVCRKNGIQGSNTDFLICAVAVRNEFMIFTRDKDFDLFAVHIPIKKYVPRKVEPADKPNGTN
ncbi:PIN domain-containing protein [bacterium]|nr:PIN domain-containing protein [bacterium]